MQFKYLAAIASVVASVTAVGDVSTNLGISTRPRDY